MTVNSVCLLMAIVAGGVYAAEGPAPEPPLATTTAFVAFWNVENLFDTVDDPEFDEGDFTPGGSKQWSLDRLATKYERLARVIRDMDEGRGPDLLGLCEVENRTALLGLLPYLTGLGRDYRIVHQESPSDRGIDCALLYDANVFDLLSSAFHYVDADATRDIVRAELSLEGERLNVFVNHWPSRGGDPDGVHRREAARVLRAEVDELLTLDADADIVIVGDFNDEPGDASVKDVLRAVASPGAGSTDLFNAMLALGPESGPGTYRYRDEWQVIDQIVLSQGLQDAARLSWVPGSTVVIRAPYQLYQPGTAGERPNRTYGGDAYYGGFSDHLPVACSIRTSD